MQKKIKRSFMYLFILSLAMAPFSSVLADTPVGFDIEGHWAEEELSEWINNGHLEGYDDGSIRPDDHAERSEIVALINRAFNFTDTTDVSELTDLAASDWFYEDVQKAVQAGYIEGFEDQTFRAENQTTRQQVAVMVARILDLDEEAHIETVNQFIDRDDIPEWSAGAIGAIVEEGIMEGYPKGDFDPAGLIDRAEVIAALDRALDAKEAVDTTVYDEAGVVGSETETETIEGNVIVNVEDVTLQNMVITGDLLLSEGIGEGEVTLTNVTVEGTTTVQGGGEDSVHLVNSELHDVIVNKEEGNVRIVASGSTQVESVQLDSSTTLETKDMSGAGLKNVSVNVSDKDIVLSGDFENVEIEAPNAIVNITNGSIKQLIVNDNAVDSKIDVSTEAEVDVLTLNAATEVKGEGTIKQAEINANGSKLDQQPEEIIINGEDVSVEVEGEEVTESTPSTPPGNGGGTSPGDDDDQEQPALVSPDRLSEGSTKVPGVTYTAETGKVTLTVDTANAAFAETTQNPNTELGANEKVAYHEVRVSKPEGAVYVDVHNESLPESEKGQVSLEDYAFTYSSDGEIKGVMSYFGVGVKDSATGQTAPYDENRTYQKVITWYDQDNNVIQIDQYAVDVVYENPVAEPVNVDRLSEGSTKVPGVTYTAETGKVTLTIDTANDAFAETTQNPNTELGANEEVAYHEVRVSKPEGAVYVDVHNESLPESEKGQVSLEDYAFTYSSDGEIKGVMSYFGVGVKDTDTGQTAPYDENRTYQKVITWYDQDKNVIQIDQYEVDVVYENRD